ncbi:hypothetical protein KY366_04800 [Candidatus Woesearchaeota archaeon]|nr:hypothetical protein [Candidatus Woesearchaeota archaeon]
MPKQIPKLTNNQKGQIKQQIRDIEYILDITRKIRAICEKPPKEREKLALRLKEETGDPRQQEIFEKIADNWRDPSWVIREYNKSWVKDYLVKSKSDFMDKAGIKFEDVKEILKGKEEGETEETKPKEEGIPVSQDLIAKLDEEYERAIRLRDDFNDLLGYKELEEGERESIERNINNMNTNINGFLYPRCRIGHACRAKPENIEKIARELAEKAEGKNEKSWLLDIANDWRDPSPTIRRLIEAVQKWLEGKEKQYDTIKKELDAKRKELGEAEEKTGDLNGLIQELDGIDMIIKRFEDYFKKVLISNVLEKNEKIKVKSRIRFIGVLTDFVSDIKNLCETTPTDRRKRALRLGKKFKYRNVKSRFKKIAENSEDPYMAIREMIDHSIKFMLKGLEEHANEVYKLMDQSTKPGEGGKGAGGGGLADLMNSLEELERRTQEFENKVGSASSIPELSPKQKRWIENCIYYKKDPLDFLQDIKKLLKARPKKRRRMASKLENSSGTVSYSSWFEKIKENWEDPSDTIRELIKAEQGELEKREETLEDMKKEAENIVMEVANSIRALEEQEGEIRGLIGDYNSALGISGLNEDQIRFFKKEIGGYESLLPFYSNIKGFCKEKTENRKNKARELEEKGNERGERELLKKIGKNCINPSAIIRELIDVVKDNIEKDKENLEYITGKLDKHKEYELRVKS